MSQTHFETEKCQQLCCVFLYSCRSLGVLRGCHLASVFSQFNSIEEITKNLLPVYWYSDTTSRRDHVMTLPSSSRGLNLYKYQLRLNCIHKMTSCLITGNGYYVIIFSKSQLHLLSNPKFLKRLLSCIKCLPCAKNV